MTLVYTVNLKNKTVIFYQQNWAYSGMAENCNWRHADCGKTIGKSHQQREGMSFYGEKGGSWEGLF